MRLSTSTGAAAFNWDVYKPVTKGSAGDVCDSTSAGSSDAENGDHLSSASDEIPPRQANPAVAMVWLMGAMSFVPNNEEHAQPNTNCKSRHHRSRRGHRGTAWVAPPPAPSAPPGLASGFSAPPGLSAPMPIAPPPGLGPAPPPGLPAPTHFPTSNATSDIIKDREEGPFETKVFRKELVATLRELSAVRNVARAVRRVRAQRVPEANQAAEFADLLTRAAEEPRGAIRRLWWAFAAGLGAGVDAPDGSAFTPEACKAGMQAFFQDTFPDLCEEIHRLPVAAKSELVPTLRTVFPEQVMVAVLPAMLC